MYQLCRCVIRTPYIIYILASCLSLFHFIAPLLHSYTPLTNWSLYETRFPFYRKIHKFGGKHSSRFCLSPLEFQFKCPFIYSQNNNERCYPQLEEIMELGSPVSFFPQSLYLWTLAVMSLHHATISDLSTPSHPEIEIKYIDTTPIVFCFELIWTSTSSPLPQ